MYKIFEVTYNDGGWHSGPLPHFFYIAEKEEELILNGLTTSKPSSEKAGCFGSINGGLTALILAAAVVVLKKKKD